MNIRRLLLIMMLSFFCLYPAMSQDRPSRFLNLYEFHVRPGHTTNWENFVKKVVESADKVNATQRWMTFQAVMGAESGTYYVTIPFEKWGDLDAWTQVPQMLSAAYGEEEAQKILQGSGEAASFRLETYALLEDFTTNFDPNRYASNLYRVIRTQVKPEMNSTYRSLLARASSVEKADSDSPSTIRRATVLGEHFRYLASIPFNSFADLDTMQTFAETVEASMSELETQELYNSLRQCVDSREMFVLALRRDLSRLPQ